MQHADDLDRLACHAIENDIGMHQDRPQSRLDLIARTPCQRPLPRTFARTLNVSQESVSNLG